LGSAPQNDAGAKKATIFSCAAVIALVICRQAIKIFKKAVCGVD
jgi:hypothetical protein